MAAPDVAQSPEAQALVVQAHGRHYLIEADDGRRLIGHPRGKRSECVVGDHVLFQATDAREAVIEQVLPRRNLLHRQDEWRTKSFASNLDQVLILVAALPVFSESHLSRSLIAAGAAGIPSLIVLNKADLPEAETALDRLAPYARMGQTCLKLSLKQDAQGAMVELMPRLEGRITLVLGASGTGKSTLTNLLVPGAGASTGELSQALQAGRHTTTHTTLYWIERGRTALIDSPGFQEFGLRQVKAQDLASLMPDISACAGQCRFYNCTHLHEPGCGVIEGVQQGLISPSRYRIYGEIHEELSRTRW